MKAILILPEMPSGCAECILARMNVDGEMICAASEDKPWSCPLKEMPEKREEEMMIYNVRGDATSVRMDYRAQGWNDCLRAIEGSGEDA